MTLADGARRSTFGPFELCRLSGRLLRDGRPVEIQALPLKLLTLLVGRPGELVGHDEVKTHLWPGWTVTEHSHRTTLRKLRRALGDDSEAPRFVETVPGRGLRFVHKIDVPPDSVGTSDCPRPPPTSPALIGREREVLELCRWLEDSSAVVAVVGPPGVGKTALTRVCCDAIRAAGREATYVDLCEVERSELAPQSVAAAVGLGQWDPTEGVAAFRARGGVLVLDNAEHVLDAVRELCALLSGAVAILVTSRVRPRASRERLFPLAPLAVPDPRDDPRAIAASPAVRLYLGRAQRLVPELVLTDANAEVIGELVRVLDGVPLAIELAATRVRLLGPAAMLGRLRNEADPERIGVLSQPAAPDGARHRSLSQAIALSWSLLTDPERTALAQLSLLRGALPLPVAEALVQGADPHATSIDLLDALVDHCLVQVRQVGGEPMLVLLDAVRTFAEARRAEPLGEGGEEVALRRAVLAAFDWVDRPHREEDPSHGVAALPMLIRAASIAVALGMPQAPMLLERLGEIHPLPILLELIPRARAWGNAVPFGEYLLHLTHGRVLRARGRLGEAHDEYQAALAFGVLPQEPQTLALARIRMARLFQHMGRFDVTESWWIASLEATPADRPDMTLSCRIGLAWARAHLGHPEPTREIRASLADAPPWPATTLFGWNVVALIQRWFGPLDAVDASLDRAAAALASGADASGVRDLRAILANDHGRHAEALEELAHARARLRGTGHVAVLDELAMETGRAHAGLGATAEARTLLQGVLARTESVLLQAEVRLVLAEICLAESDAQGALELLDAAIPAVRATCSLPLQALWHGLRGQVMRTVDRGMAERESAAGRALALSLGIHPQSRIGRWVWPS